MNAEIIAGRSANITQYWRRHGVALGALVFLIGLGFYKTIVTAVSVWIASDAYSHCFLIIPISLWLIWEKRASLKQLTPDLEPRALWLLPPLLLLWGLGELSTINELRQLAVVGIVQVAALAMLGTTVYRFIWFPLLYLFFLVPMGEYLIGPMQRFATHFADISLTLIGIPHYTEGTIIELTNGSFEVAEECAGLRFLIATIALGVLFAHTMFREWYKVVIFMTTSVVVPLIGNGLRIVGVILLAHFTNNKYGVGFDHLVYGWGFNVALLLILFLIGALFRDSMQDADMAVSANTTPKPAISLVAVFATSALLITLAPALAYWHDSRAIEPDVAALDRPLHLSDWQAMPETGLWRPDTHGVDAEFALSLVSKSAAATSPVDLYVGYYGRSRTEHSVTSHINQLWNPKKWAWLSSDTKQAQLNGHAISVQEWIVTSATEKRLIWATYWVDGQFTTSLLRVKLMQAGAALEGHEGEALVAISTVIDGTDNGARKRLRDVLLALGDLPDRLNGANHRGNAPSN